MMYGYDPIYLLVIGVPMILSYIVSNRLKHKFELYSKTYLSNGMSGREIAEKMLGDNGITDVTIESVQGSLTDHYNPVNKTVNLSEPVYNSRSAAAAAVAAHECGHAVQHAKGYAWLNMRSKLVPIVNFSSKFLQWVLLLGIAIYAGSHNSTVLWIGIIMFSMTTLFSVITLPVEYDASNRALAWMEKSHIVQSNELAEAKDALKWAARTYVVAALGSLAQLFYFISIAMNDNRRD